MSLVYLDICVEGGAHLQTRWPFSRKSNQPQPNIDALMANKQNKQRCEPIRFT